MPCSPRSGRCRETGPARRRLQNIVDRYQKLVRSCVRQYRGSPEPTEDLMQVGYVGLLKAINNYDPEVGDSLSLRAALHQRRDQAALPRQAVADPRPSVRQNSCSSCVRATEELPRQLGRAPEEAELAERLGVSRTTCRRRARRTSCSARTRSTPDVRPGRPRPGWRTCSATTTRTSPRHRHGGRQRALGGAAEREQRILVMRFYGNLTQTEIGERLGISQDARVQAPRPRAGFT